MSKHLVCHVEWEVSDLERAKAFYGGLFGWNFQQFTDEMLSFGSGDQHVGGLMRVENPTPGSSPSVWIEVDDVELMCAAAKGLGGMAVAEKSPVPHVGWSAVIADHDGNRIGMVQFDRS